MRLRLEAGRRNEEESKEGRMGLSYGHEGGMRRTARKGGWGGD